MLAAVVGLNVGLSSASTQAQTEDGGSQAEGWLTPLNLSRSGSAENPVMVVDDRGTLHVLWQEAPAGSFYYASRTDDVWQPPQPISPPFGTAGTDSAGGSTAVQLFTPRLFGDDNGRIHAFWLDDKNTLFYSRVLSTEVASTAGWVPPEPLFSDVVSFDVAGDQTTTLFVSAIQKQANSRAAGVYGRRLSLATPVWSDAALIYESAYYRGQTAGDSGLALTVGPVMVTPTVPLPPPTPSTTNTVAVPPPSPIITDGVILFWENAPLEQLFLSVSGSEDAVWNTPQLVDRRRSDDPAGGRGPTAPQLAYWDDELYLFWQAGHQTSCELYQQRSADHGQSWTSPLPVALMDADCPDRYTVFSDSDEILLLMTFSGQNTTLWAWNGSAWSDGQPQPLLTRFEDPGTIRQIDFDCLQSLLLDGPTLVVAGCGRSQSFSDIWFIERELSDVDSWYPEQEFQIWNTPLTLLNGNDELRDPVILADSQGDFHAFWIANPLGDEGGQTRIYHTRYDGTSWTRAIPLLTLEGGPADQLAGLFDQNGLLFMTWRDAVNNQYYFSAVAGEQMDSPSDWSNPKLLPVLDELVTAPHLVLDHLGRINITFAVPLNERRGIYTVRTVDGGKTWAGPLQVADGAAAGMAMVDRPQLTQTANGDLHVIWTAFELKPSPEPIALYYARSSDNGNSWSPPENISQGTTTWSTIASSDSDNVVIIWKQEFFDQEQILARKSIDGGVVWNPVEAILSSGDTVADPLLNGLSFNHLHIFQLTGPNLASMTLQNRGWLNSEWQEIVADPLPLGDQPIAAEKFAAGLSPDGLVAVLILASTVDDSQIENGRPATLAMVTNRLETLPVVASAVSLVEAAPLEETAPEPQATAEVEDAGAPPSTPVPAQAQIEEGASIEPTDAPLSTAAAENPVAINTDPPAIDDSPSSVTLFANALIPVVAFIGLTFGLLLYFRRRN